MPAQAIELILDHDGQQWRLQGLGQLLQAPDLPKLDRALALALGSQGLTRPVTVHMRFNRSALPGWTRQYQPHYFNRTVQITPVDATEVPA